jgi:hypothetical protein
MNTHRSGCDDCCIGIKAQLFTGPNTGQLESAQDKAVCLALLPDKVARVRQEFEE